MLLTLRKNHKFGLFHMLMSCVNEKFHNDMDMLNNYELKMQLKQQLIVNFFN